MKKLERIGRDGDLDKPITNKIMTRQNSCKEYSSGARKGTGYACKSWMYRLVTKRTLFSIISMYINIQYTLIY